MILVVCAYTIKQATSNCCARGGGVHYTNVRKGDKAKLKESVDIVQARLRGGDAYILTSRGEARRE